MSQPSESSVHVPGPMGNGSVAQVPQPDVPVNLPAAALSTYRGAYQAHKAEHAGATHDQCDAAGWAAVRAAWRQTDGGWVQKSAFARLLNFAKSLAADDDEGDGVSKPGAFDGVAKAVGDQRLVFGWANVVVKDSAGQVIPDRQGDCVDLASLECVAYDFIEHERETNVMHVGKANGCAVESVIFTEEKLQKMLAGIDISPDARAEVVAKLAGRWWFGARVEPDVFDRVRSGSLSMLSIEGTGSREEIAA